jgi:hypothetical protein
MHDVDLNRPAARVRLYVPHERPAQSAPARPRPGGLPHTGRAEQREQVTSGPSAVRSYASSSSRNSGSRPTRGAPR